MPQTIKFHVRAIGEIIQRLVLMWEVLGSEDMENEVEFI